MLIVRWFLSKTVRQAVNFGRHVRRLTRAQKDLLPPLAVEELNSAVRELKTVVAKGESLDTIREWMKNLETVANKRLKPYPHPGWRENVDVLLVTGAVVLAIRTFFFQPMAIPSGSAQPTLYGITEVDLRDQPDFQIPGFLQRMVDFWWSGERYYHVKAEADGVLRKIGEPKMVFPFIKKQQFVVGDQTYTVWFPVEDLAKRAQLQVGQRFEKGEDIMKLKVTSGDHLIVNRMTYNFRRPERGEIIVFTSEGMSPPLIPNTHYIKRLVALPGDHVRIGNDRHLIINGERLDATTPHFELVYGFDPDAPPRDSEYSGHVNASVARRYVNQNFAPKFPDERTEFIVRPGHYLAMGDNTMNSYDGRAWGDFPREKVIGKAGFVFWPISSRFGYGYR